MPTPTPRRPFKLHVWINLKRVAIKMPSVYIAIMIKTQIQLPDCLYREAKRVAEEREMSLAEVLRRGVEYITRVYPPLKAVEGRPWLFPRAVHAHLRKGVALEGLRDLAASDEEPQLADAAKSIRQGGKT